METILIITGFLALLLKDEQDKRTCRKVHMWLVKFTFGVILFLCALMLILCIGADI